MLVETCLALAIYWEARNQPIRGQMAVAEVVLNRAADHRFPSKVCEVIMQGCQFSWYCDGKSDVPKEKKAWYHSFNLAKAIINSNKRLLPRNTLYFHSTKVSPPFFKKKKFITRIGDHLFYGDH
jgi:N-acetylmuramoyl-L-alanine amidase